MTDYTEGFVSFENYKTYYKVYGNLASGRAPLMVLHGGPGYPHYYLENLSELANYGIPVVFYDQLGCGKSDRPDNPKLWTVELFLDELAAVRQALKLDTIFLLGHSWGGSLAVEYMLTHPTGLKKLILSSPLLDTHLWVSEADKLKDKLEPATARVMRRHEAAGTTNSAEYQTAYNEFLENFVCRAKPYPEASRQSDKEMGIQVYETMWGPSEAHATGTLKDWSVLDGLHEITVPTLLLSGKYDEATPAQIELAHKAIRGSKWILFENSSHTANREEPAQYLQAVRDFLA